MHLKDEPQAKDVMETEVSVIEAHATAMEAAAKMRENGERQLVVVSENTAIGMIVDRDITRDLVAIEKDPNATTVNDIMSTNLVTVEEHQTVRDIARAMITHHVSRVPVVRGDQLVGLITYHDLLRMWPGYVDVLKEELELTEEEYAGMTAPQDTELSEGYCSSCENYSTELVHTNRQWLCPDCAPRQ